MDDGWDLGPAAPAAHLHTVTPPCLGQLSHSTLRGLRECYHSLRGSNRYRVLAALALPPYCTYTPVIIKNIHIRIGRLSAS